MKVCKFLLKFSIFSFLSIIVIITGLYIYAYLSPKLDLKKSGSLYLYDANNELIYQGSRTNEWANLEEISDNLKNAVIAVEDKNFYKHHGFDFLRIIKALETNIRKKSISQGASTISQQYIKNLYLDFNQTWKRKIEEAFLTLELEVHYDKDEILEGYLNSINYGQGNIGIVNASHYYFNKKPSELSLEEAIILAGIPKNPKNYNPVTNYDAAINRAWVVAKSMFNNGYIDEDTYNNLFKNKIEIYGNSKHSSSQMLMYYQEAVLNELKSINEIPEAMINAGGLKIYTTLNPEIQKNMEQNIIDNYKEDGAQIASVIVNPSNGEVLALTGGKNYKESQYNRALYSKRQVGSTMKPFLYYAALENNMTAASTFSSELTTFNLSNNTVYAPQNAGNIYANKDITMAAAIALSDNIYAIKTNLFLGPDKMISVAKRCGIDEKLEEIASLPLGTNEINILDFAEGYATFASGGYKKDIHFIKKIEDLDGNILYEYKNYNEMVLNSNYVYILNEMLTSTTNNSFVDYTTPTALNISSKLTKKYAIKTGSTNTDFWIVGYNPETLMIIWTGFDDNKDVNNNIRNEAKNIWASTMEFATFDNNEWYDKPKNVTSLVLDAITGKYPSNNNKSAIFFFVNGSVPVIDEAQYVSKEKD